MLRPWLEEHTASGARTQHPTACGGVGRGSHAVSGEDGVANQLASTRVLQLLLLRLYASP